ncbi:Gfo/Idh/MocA family oxidoreductase [Lentibacillus cibarius]|uniref:Gfo/Idh/MocA family oxidoreductase n=1 Tax=Lentibacillus cibarius TaxID=2583219 RepID=A0A5S3QLS1_9BACI|nr:Gfo/Idh/MocA family oxidoreductase [Lentibacillus cibarius]
MIRVTNYRVGIIGTGFGARVHAPMMNLHNGFEVVAIASVRGNVDSARKLSGIDNIYTDWKAMLEQESLDLLVVASAVFAHEEMVQTAFAKGLHVLCEKPMALNAAETEGMIAARDQAGKWGFINHEFRFLPAQMKVKAMIENGDLGNVMHIRYAYTHTAYTPLTSKRRGWLGQKEDGGGLLNALGSHMIDSLHWWTNSSMKALNANLITHVPEYTDEEGNVEHRTADDAFQVIGSLQNNSTVMLDLISAARKASHTKRLEVFGDQSTLVMLDDTSLFVSSGEQPFEEVSLDPGLTAPDTVSAAVASHYSSFKPMLDALHETLRTGQKHTTLANFENGQTTQKVLDAIRQSAREEKKVVLE